MYELDIVRIAAKSPPKDASQHTAAQFGAAPNIWLLYLKAHHIDMTGY